MKKILTLLALAFCLNGKAQIITTIAGNGTLAFAGDGGQATNAELATPDDITFDAFGNLYIADQWNGRIRKVSTAGIITTFAGDSSISGFSGDGGPATSAALVNPKGVACDALGNLYISSDYNYRVRMVNTSGIITTIAGTGNYGYSGDGAAATAAELYPRGLALDAAGNLYIADAYNNCIRKVNSSGIISTVVGNGFNAGTGYGGFSGDGGQATAASLYFPTGISFDASGNLYIADTYNMRVRMVNTAGIITTIVGNGSISSPRNGGFSGDGGQATAAELNQPSGAVLDGFGNLYVIDSYNAVIRKVNTAGIINTIIGIPTWQGYDGDGGLANNAHISYPTNAIIDPYNNLYFADSDNHRIRKVTNVSTVGLEQFINNKEQINIYPNPNNGSFVIEPSSTTKQTLQVYDVTGKLVLSQTINGKTTIDANSLNEGVYNISLQSNEGVVNKRLVIVR